MPDSEKPREDRMSRFGTRLTSTFTAAVLCLALAACADGDGTGPDPVGSGDVSVRLVQSGASASVGGLLAAVTPGPGHIPLESVEAIELTLSRIEVHRTGLDDDESESDDEVEGEDAAEDEGEEEGEDEVEDEGEEEAEADDEEEEADDDGGGWISIELSCADDSDCTINLLDLPSADASASAVVAEGTLPAGYYNNIRLFYSAAVVRLSDEVEVGATETLAPADYGLTIPSGPQTGLKVPGVGFEIVDGGFETILIEILTEASVHNLRWMGSDFKMTPVLHFAGTEDVEE